MIRTQSLGDESLPQSVSEGPNTQTRSVSEGIPLPLAEDGRRPGEGIDDSLFADLVEQLTANLAVGDQSAAEGLLANHPADADRLRRLLPTLQVLTDLDASIGSDKLAQSSTDAPSNPQSEACDLQSLGDYRLLREIGRGGMGVVYEAEQISLRRRVALKVLPFVAALDPRQLQRFKNEALAAASLHHEHIIPVYSVGHDRGVHFYAMQFIDGCTLADVIAVLANDNPQRERGKPPNGAGGNALRGVPNLSSNRDGAESPSPSDFPNPQSEIPIPKSAADTKPIAGLLTDKSGSRGREYYRRAAELIADAASALEHAHSLGIVHRDIKPSNLLIDSSGKLLIGDFGLARFGADAGLTMTGDLIGTLRYMAPEQALAQHGLVDHRADIYSLGCTLYELLTLRPAIPATDRAEILHKLAFNDPTPLRKLDKRIPSDLETITLKCLAKSSAERYTTARELADDVNRFARNEPINARPPTAAQRISNWSRRHSYLVRSAAAIITTSAIALAVATYLIAGKEKEVRRAFVAEAGERKRAEAGERQAQANLESALDAVDRLLAQLGTSYLYEAAEAQPLRRKILDDALRLYENLRQQSGNSEKVSHRMAKTWCHMAFLLEELGDSDAAKHGHTSALELIEQLLSESPDRLDYLNTCGDCCIQAGRFYVSNDKYANAHEAAQLNTRAAELFAILVHSGSAPTNSTPYSFGSFVNRQIEALTTLARVAHPRQQSEVLAKCVALGDSAGDEALPALVEALRQRADLLEPTSPDEADADDERAVALLRKWFAQEQIASSHQHQSAFSSTLFHAARRYRARHPDRAIELYMEAIPIKRKVYETFKSNIAYRSSLGAQVRELAQLIRDQVAAAIKRRDNDQAAAFLRKGLVVGDESIALRRDAIKSSSNDPGALGMLAGALFEQAQRIGTLSKLTNQGVDAITLARADAVLAEAIDTLRSAVPADEKRLWLRDALATHLAHKADVLLERSGKKESDLSSALHAKREAALLLTEAIGHRRWLVAASPDDKKLQAKLNAIEAIFERHFGQSHIRPESSELLM